MQPVLSLADASSSAYDGMQVQITLKDCNGSETVLSGTMTSQPTKQQMGILLDGRFHFGRANRYSQTTYRLLIGNQILIRHAAEVRLIALSLWLMAFHF